MQTDRARGEAILESCREIIAKEGLSALNMRAVARRSGVALGLLYYYYPSKEALTLAAVESVWAHIFHPVPPGEAAEALPFPDYLGQWFGRVSLEIKKYPHFLSTHALLLAGDGQGSAKMAAYAGHMRGGLLKALRMDKSIPPACFQGALSEEAFIRFILTQALSLLAQGQEDCAGLLEITRRVLAPQAPTFKPERKESP